MRYSESPDWEGSHGRGVAANDRWWRAMAHAISKEARRASHGGGTPGAAGGERSKREGGRGLGEGTTR